MINQKQITKSKIFIILPRIISIAMFLFLAYVNIVLIFSYNIMGYEGLMDGFFLALTIVLGIIVCTPGTKLCLLSNTTGNFSILEKALYFNKYRVKKVLPISDIVNVETIEIKRSTKHGEHIFIRLNIKDNNGNVVFSKEYIQKQKLLAESDAEQIRNVLDGNADSFFIMNYNYILFEYIFILMIIIQLLVNWNYIKQIFLSMVI